MTQEVTFESLKLSSPVLKVLEEMGFTNPTEIQAKAIPVLLDTKKDFVGQAQTGTGKTAAFVIPLLERIDFQNRNVQALVLAPTRELAFQVESEIKKLGKHTKVKSTCVYGGTGYEPQIRALKKDRPHIVVGTPGRIIDMINKGILKLDDAKFAVLDEADEMLNMGFLEDVQVILESFQSERQLMMFSATMPQAIIKLIKKTFNEHEIVKIEKKTLSNEDIEQKYFIVREKHFREALSRLIDDAEDMYGLVFCKTKIETREVADDLKKRGHSVEVLNGDMGQNERDHAMNNFKNKKSTIMVCTDVAARGIDINNLTHVFNLGIPRDNESYVHRIGRTGRAGMKGKAYSIIGPKAVYSIKHLERHIMKKIEPGKLPSVESLKFNIVEKEIENAQFIMDAIAKKGDDFKTEESYKLFAEKFGDLSNEDLLKLMFVWKFNKEMRHLNNLEDIETVAVSSGSGRSGRTRNRTRNVGGRGRNDRGGRSDRGDRNGRREAKSGGSGSGRSRRSSFRSAAATGGNSGGATKSTRRRHRD